MIDLSIIIVSYNTKELTRKCIESIINNTHIVSYEIIIVDNASTDGSVEYMDSLGRDKSRLIPTIKIITNKENLGYAKANNQGIKAALGQAILLLNSDTIIQKNSIDEACEHLQSADILTVNLKNKDMTNQQAAGFGPNIFNIFCWAFFIDDIPVINKLLKPYQISDLSFFKNDHEVDWVMGAFFLMKKSVSEKIGMLDENIFMYGEEMEYCRRAKNAGFKTSYFSNPKIIHFGMGSSETSEGAIVGEYKALKYFFHKYSPGWQEFALCIIIKLSAGIRAMIYKMTNPTRFKIYEKAFKII